MKITIELTDGEMESLRKMISRHKAFETRECSLEDAIHECIRTALYDESEEDVQSGGM